MSAINVFIEQEKQSNREQTNSETVNGPNQLVPTADLNYGFKIAGVYTFGQPKVGDISFQKYFRKQFRNNLIRFVNNSDIVPRIPNIISLINLSYFLRSWKPYNYKANIGQRYYISFFGNILYPGDSKSWIVFIRDRLIGVVRFILAFPKVIWIVDHSMNLYIKSINKNIKKLEANPSSETQGKREI